MIDWDHIHYQRFASVYKCTDNNELLRYIVHIRYSSMSNRKHSQNVNSSNYGSLKQLWNPGCPHTMMTLHWCDQKQLLGMISAGILYITWKSLANESYFVPFLYSRYTFVTCIFNYTLGHHLNVHNENAWNDPPICIPFPNENIKFNK